MLKRKTFKDIWEASPPFFYALSRASSLSRARHAIMAYFASRKLDIRAAESRNHPLEWIVIDDSVDAMKNIFSERSEELAGVSALEIFRKQARGETPETEVSDGFLEEFYRLLLGVENKSGIYDDTAIPEYLELEGREAALERLLSRASSVRPGPRESDGPEPRRHLVRKGRRKHFRIALLLGAWRGVCGDGPGLTDGFQ